MEGKREWVVSVGGKRRGQGSAGGDRRHRQWCQLVRGRPGDPDHEEDGGTGEKVEETTEERRRTGLPD